MAWVILFLIPCFSWQVFAQDYSAESLDAAYNHYKSGETAVFATVRDKEFNTALSLYRKVEQSSCSGKLYYNIANCYFQLGETPTAIFYYERALLQIPRNSRCLYNLSCAQLKAGLSIEDCRAPSWIDRLCPAAYRVSLLELQKGYLGCLLAWLFVSVLSNVTKYVRLASIQRYLAIAAFFCALLILYSSFGTSLEGVVLKSSGLYTDSGKQYALIRPRPVLAGTKVRILKVSLDRKWYLVRLGTTEKGYVPVESVRLL